MVHSKNMNLEAQVRAGVIGHAIGDALGVPVEFSSRESLQKRPIRDMEGFGVHNVPAGTWSDDTSMEVALMQSLIDCGYVNYDGIMRNFGKWAYDDEFTATGRTFDIGGTCSAAISNYLIGHKSPKNCGETGERSNGNGSLMRILPVAYICHAQNLSDEDTFRLTRDVSALTHAHEISVAGCYIYVNFIRHLLDAATRLFDAVRGDPLCLQASVGGQYRGMQDGRDFFERLRVEQPGGSHLVSVDYRWLCCHRAEGR